MKFRRSQLKYLLVFLITCFTQVQLDALGATCTYECKAGEYIRQSVCTKCDKEFIANYLVGLLGGHTDVYSESKKYYCEKYKVSVQRDEDKPCDDKVKKQAYGHNIRECAGGTVANSDYSGCVEAEDKSKNYSGCVDPAPDELLAGNIGVLCKRGYFLPDGSRKCCPCNDTNLNKIKDILEKNFASTGFDVSRAYCPDKCLAWFNENTTSCVQFCEEPKTVNANHTACVTKTTVTSSSEQSTTEATEISCPDGQVEKNGKCVAAKACAAGQIWNPQTGKCEACNSHVEWINYANENRMFCPGVTNTKLPVLQQLKKCPKGAWPNTGLTGCDCRWGTKDGDTCKNMTISASDLQYGPKGKSAPLVEQCWTKSTPTTYKKCMGFDD